MDSPPATDATEARRARRWWKVVLACLVVLVVLLLWLNGPGFRWLVPVAARHFIEKAGMRGDFELEGTLAGGFRVKRLDLHGGSSALKQVAVGSLDVDYSLSDLMEMRVKAVRIDGLHLDLDVTKREKEEKAPVDLTLLGAKYQDIRRLILPMEVEIRNLSVSAARGEEPVFSLAKSAITHRAGSGQIGIGLGAMKVLDADEVPQQQTMLGLESTGVSLDRVTLLPQIGARGLAVELPVGMPPSGEVELRLGESVLAAQAMPGLKEATFALRNGPVDLAKLTQDAGKPIPIHGRLMDFSGKLTDFWPRVGEVRGELHMRFAELGSFSWEMPELVVDGGLGEKSATVSARGNFLGSAIALDANADVARSGDQLRVGKFQGDYEIAEFRELLAGLGSKVDALKSQPAVPPSQLGGHFASMDDGGVAFSASLAAKNPQDAAAIDLQGSYDAAKRTLPISLKSAGLQADATVFLESSEYKGTATLEKFRWAGIEPWLRMLEKPLGLSLDADARWSGGGNLVAKRHWGNLAIIGAHIEREQMPPVDAAGDVRYRWPGHLAVADLKLETEGQRILADATLEKQILDLAALKWSDGDGELFDARGKLPVPEDLKQWRAALRADARPVEFQLRSREIPLARLQAWLPSASKLDGAATVRLHADITGAPANLRADVEFHARDLRAVGKPGLPPARADLRIQVRDGMAKLDGASAAKDFPESKLAATLPFDPAAWVENPASLRSVPLKAEAEFPRLDLSRFISLVPTLKKLDGVVTGYARIGGTIGKPEISAQMDLANGAMETTTPAISPVQDIGVVVDMNEREVTLTTLRAKMAGGTLNGGGKIALNAWKPATVDLRITADHLPLARNESLIARANADIRVTGPWERATVAGSVGIVDSLFYRDIELLPVGTPLGTPKPAALPGSGGRAPRNISLPLPAPFAAWPLDLGVRTINPFLVRGNLATGEATVDLKIGGTMGSPAPDGVISISQVKASLPFSTLEVKHGTITFTPQTGLDPALEIRGTAAPRPYKVTAYLYGRASDPKLVLTSSPPLEENEILTLLATGTTPSGLEDPQMATNRAIQLFAEEVRRGRIVGSRYLRPVLKMLDRVEFSLAESDPYSPDRYSTATLMLTDKWNVSIGMSSEGYTRAMLIWKIVIR